MTKVDLGFCQNGTSHWLLGEAVRAAAMQPTRLGHPRFLDAVSAQTADFNEVRSSKNPAILGLMRLNFLSVAALSTTFPTTGKNKSTPVLVFTLRAPRWHRGPAK